jgi:hypothetical protein
MTDYPCTGEPPKKTKVLIVDCTKHERRQFDKGEWAWASMKREPVQVVDFYKGVPNEPSA